MQLSYAATVILHKIHTSSTKERALPVLPHKSWNPVSQLLVAFAVVCTRHAAPHKECVTKALRGEITVAHIRKPQQALSKMKRWPVT